MTTHSTHEHNVNHNRLFAWIWIYLLALTAVEVVLAYVHILPPTGMLVLLMALSIVKAAMIIAYFMHLRFERTHLILSLVPAGVVVICLLFVFFPDSFRLLELRVR